MGRDKLSSYQDQRRLSNREVEKCVPERVRSRAKYSMSSTSFCGTIGEIRLDASPHCACPFAFTYSVSFVDAMAAIEQSRDEGGSR